MAILGKGTTFSYGDTAIAATTAVAEVTDVGFPELDTEDVETTHYLSANGVKEFIAGWSEGGDVALELNFTKAQHAALLAIRGLAKFFKITLPDGSTYVWPGYIKRVGGAAPNKDKVTSSATIKVAGVPVFTAAA